MVRGWLDGGSDASSNVGNNSRDSKLFYKFSVSFIIHFQILGFHGIDCEGSCLFDVTLCSLVDMSVIGIHDRGNRML